MGSNKLIVRGVIILVVLVAAFLFYRFYFVDQGAQEPEGLNSLNFSEEGGGQGTDEFIALINELQGVDLKTDLFANPAFQALENFGKPLIPEPKGRPNPFLPISSVVGSASSTASSTRPR